MNKINDIDKFIDSVFNYLELSRQYKLMGREIFNYKINNEIKL